MKFLFFLTVALVSLYEVHGVIKISAFNIQVFGQSKIGKQHVVDILVDILNRYDVTVIQEIRDSAQTAIYSLLDQVNAQAGVFKYSMVLSERLGRTSSKEQYAWFYKANKMTVVKTYQYPDTADVFERPPMVVKFSSSGAIGTWSMLGTHVKPSDAVAEIDALVDVYDEARKFANLNTNNMLLAGDFNAACSYVRASDWPNIRLRTDNRFTWLIGDDINTTLANSNCAYDRLVTAGSTTSAFVPGTAAAFNYWSYYNLSETVAKEVSDHYPVHMDVYD